MNRSRQSLAILIGLTLLATALPATGAEQSNALILLTDDQKSADTVSNGHPVLKTPPVEHESRWWLEGQGGSLGTVYYTPSENERPFFSRLAPDEVATGSHFDDYDISTKDGKYVGWFGIVRQIDEDTTANRTTLTVEHKYFDGLTDAHLQAVSFNGSGDFQAVLAGTGHRIPPLSLVKVYGTVTQGKEGTLPRIDVVFVRNWHWGTFTFLDDYGTQRGSAQWRKANQVPLEEIYDPWPHPCQHYYEERLGKRPDAPQIRKRLLDAAGPLSPEARGAMERLADLLALGHTWSPAETKRQSEEFSQITKLLKKTGSQKGALSLLLQALRENDERVSWSATEKFAALDRSGDAVGALVELLDHETPRVRAAAARALGSGYGAKAAPAAAALSRCVAETDPEIKEYAILALGDIGPGAEAAVPALRNVLNDEDLDVRLKTAKALWQISRQPDDAIPVFTAILENGADGQRCDAADRLKEMGPWAAQAVPALVNAVKNDSYEYARCNAAEALGEIGPQAAPAIPALATALEENESDYVAARAVEALGKIGDPKAIAVLIAGLENEDSYVRMHAVWALETFGPKAKAAIPTLVRALKNDEANGCFVAAALGAIDAEGISTPVLIDALGNEDCDMRRFAAFGLSRMGRKAGAAEKALRDGLRDRDLGARIAAARAYWSVSGKADEAVGALRSVLQAPHEWLVQMWAAGALAEIGPAAKAAVPELIACLKSDARYVVSSSAEALGKIGPDAASAVPALAAQLDECDDDYCRVCIAQALWRINRSERSLPLLQDVLRDPRDYMAISGAVEALGEMGPKAKESVPLLRSLLTYSDREFRDSVAKALKEIEEWGDRRGEDNP